MSVAKERLFGAITIMSDSSAKKLWEIVQESFVENRSSWDNIEEVKPTEEEIEVIKAYKNGHPDYQPTITEEEALKQLGID